MDSSRTVMLLLAATALDGSAVGLLGIVGVSTLVYAALVYIALCLVGYS
ncbi:hypothetical protein [Halococcus agarilyticus]|nr:hypothetical protein [Halococcus agarilyticus]